MGNPMQTTQEAVADSTHWKLQRASESGGKNAKTLRKSIPAPSIPCRTVSIGELALCRKRARAGSRAQSPVDRRTDGILSHKGSHIDASASDATANTLPATVSKQYSIDVTHSLQRLQLNEITVTERPGASNNGARRHKSGASEASKTPAEALGKQGKPTWAQVAKSQDSGRVRYGKAAFRVGCIGIDYLICFCCKRRALIARLRNVDPQTLPTCEHVKDERTVRRNSADRHVRANNDQSEVGSITREQYRALNEEEHRRAKRLATLHNIPGPGLARFLWRQGFVYLNPAYESIKDLLDPHGLNDCDLSIETLRAAELAQQAVSAQQMTSRLPTSDQAPSAQRHWQSRPTSTNGTALYLPHATATVPQHISMAPPAGAGYAQASAGVPNNITTLKTFASSFQRAGPLVLDSDSPRRSAEHPDATFASIAGLGTSRPPAVDQNGFSDPNNSTRTAPSVDRQASQSSQAREEQAVEELRMHKSDYPPIPPLNDDDSCVDMEDVFLETPNATSPSYVGTSRRSGQPSMPGPWQVPRLPGFPSSSIGFPASGTRRQSSQLASTPSLGLGTDTTPTDPWGYFVPDTPAEPSTPTPFLARHPSQDLSGLDTIDPRLLSLRKAPDHIDEGLEEQDKPELQGPAHQYGGYGNP